MVARSDLLLGEHARSRVGAPAAAAACNGVEAPRRSLPPVRRAAAALLLRRARGAAGAALRRALAEPRRLPAGLSPSLLWDGLGRAAVPQLG